MIWWDVVLQICRAAGAVHRWLLPGRRRREETLTASPREVILGECLSLVTSPPTPLVGARPLPAATRRRGNAALPGMNSR